MDENEVAVRRDAVRRDVEGNEKRRRESVVCVKITSYEGVVVLFIVEINRRPPQVNNILDFTFTTRTELPDPVDLDQSGAI